MRVSYAAIEIDGAYRTLFDSKSGPLALISRNRCRRSVMIVN